MAMYVDFSIDDERIHSLRAIKSDINEYEVSILEEDSYVSIGVVQHCYTDLAFKLTQKMCELAHDYLYSDGVAIYMTREQSIDKFRQICAKMDMTAEEFVDRYDSGEYDEVDLDSVPGLVDAVIALPLWRQ